MSIKICVLTATRAEYGLLRPLIKRLLNDSYFEVAIAVTGAHLSAEYGGTLSEIISDGFPIDCQLPILVDGDTPRAVTKAMANALLQFAEYFEHNRFDFLVILGDRYEALAVSIAAMNERVPIIHIHGGETTEGAIDESVRHAITKLSYLHFTSTSEYRDRVVQLGENPDRVYNVGALGVENIINIKLLSREELHDEMGEAVELPYAMVTYHPVTLENDTFEQQIMQVLDACVSDTEMNYIFTKANADSGGRTINRIIEEYSKLHRNIYLFSSLGIVKYLSALKYSTMIIGNSSSGIIEAPSFRIPTLNIGDRQKGRIQADSVINVRPEKDEILQGIYYAKSKEFQKVCERTINPYYGGETSAKIVDNIKKYSVNDSIELKKTFFDLEYNRNN